MSQQASVCSEQDQHFRKLFYIMEHLGYDKRKFEHINFEFVKGMLTRNGTVHFIEDILETSSEAIKKLLLSKKAKLRIWKKQP